MIRFRNAMGYYDIHTHQMPFHKEDIAIINRIVSPMGDMQPGPLLDTVIRSYGIHPWYIYNVKGIGVWFGSRGDRRGWT